MNELLPFAQNFRNSVADYCTGLFDFFLREAERNAYLQGWWDDLLGLEVIVECLETGDENIVGHALEKMLDDCQVDVKEWWISPHRQYLVV